MIAIQNRRYVWLSYHNCIDVIQIRRELGVTDDNLLNSSERGKDEIFTVLVEPIGKGWLVN